MFPRFAKRLLDRLLLISQGEKTRIGEESFTASILSCQSLVTYKIDRKVHTKAETSKEAHFRPSRISGTI